jgi:hypothetical protein
VDSMSPSAYVSMIKEERTIASVRKTPSMDIFSRVRWGDRPRWRTISFMAWVMGSSELVKSSTRRFPLFELAL